MVLLLSFLHVLVASCLVIGSTAIAIGSRPNDLIKPYKRAPLQDIVTWDENSLFIHGERVMFFSGEFHPFRLPVPSLWLDVFQKIKALGYNGVSFYVDWALLEGKPGHFSAEGVFDFEPFFDAAKTAGVYLLARPGPYINAETSGGGFPGWLQRVPGFLRTYNPAYLNATNLYAQSIGEIIAKAQITNGGPVILFQPENEYTGAALVEPFPDYNYLGYVEDQFRSAGIVVPFVNNDAWTAGVAAPGTPSPVDIYGYDSYPLGFDCANPNTWPDGLLVTNYLEQHLATSPTTPHSIIEFQGGAFDPWGGNGFENCSDLLNMEFERVFYKNNFAAGMTILNLYMTYGGSNWGNLGHSGGYSSYDYGAAIAENRLITREKYSEVKLQANFLHVSPAYLVASRNDPSTSSSTSSDITITLAETNTTRLYFSRHTAYNSLDSTSYKLFVQTASFGNLTVPQLGGTLSINGRDSKIHVSDYPVGDANLVYSTAEIFTWKAYSDKTIVVIYGGPGERHELAIQQDTNDATVIEGTGVTISQKKGYTVLNWVTSSTRRVVQVHANVFVYIVDRNSAYNYWVPATPSNYTQSSLVVKAGYLVRTAEVQGTTVNLVGDLNATVPIEIIGGAPKKLSSLNFNGKPLAFKQDKNGVVTATGIYTKPSIILPSLPSLKWKYLDSLPEIKSTYSDVNWPSASLKKTYNTLYNLSTPTSLFAGDYGFNGGTLIFRGHFTANGKESTVTIHTQGGNAYGSTAWVDDKFLGSVTGADFQNNASETYTLPNLTKGRAYVLTVVVDNLGLDGNWVVGADQLKNPRGILNYTLSGHPQSDITWKITGNLGGEDYFDQVRGPLNEGGMFAERQGYHFPAPPSANWPTVVGGPLVGTTSAGIAFYSTSFDLNLPEGYDIPLSFAFTNTTVSAYRVQLFVNGYQFGKYIHNVGPQNKFPVPQGIFNHRGTNWVAVTLWALEENGAKLDGFELVADALVQTGYTGFEMSPTPAWTLRKGAY